MTKIKLIGHPDFSDIVNKKIKGIRKSGLYLAIHFENNECLLLSFERLANFDIIGRIFNLSQITWNQQVELGLLTEDERNILQENFKKENKDYSKQMIFDMIKQYEETYNERIFASR